MLTNVDESVVTQEQIHPQMRKRSLDAEAEEFVCSHADQRHAQHSQSHSEGKCDVVCGQVVRRVKEQVGSVQDQWMSCWKRRNKLVFSAKKKTLKII